MLHELLCGDDRLSYPTTYACLNPHHFVLTQARALARFRHIEVRRAQDKMLIGLSSPQEDEFALLCLGARSPYEGLLAPQHFGEALALADPKDLSNEEAQHWRITFDAFLRGVSHVSGGKPLVLKSPTHSYRVSTLRDILPDPRFILILRNPYEVFESMVRAYTALTEKFGLGPRLPDDELRSLILHERKRFESKLRSGVAGLKENRLAIVRYEHLVQQPFATIEKLYLQLELGDFEHVSEALKDEIAKRSGYTQDAVMPDPFWRHRITQEWGEIFDAYGYQKDAPS